MRLGSSGAQALRWGCVGWASLESGNNEQYTVNREQETENGKQSQETGNKKQEAGSRF